jgi:signal transduction histidine kinase
MVSRVFGADRPSMNSVPANRQNADGPPHRGSGADPRPFERTSGVERAPVRRALSPAWLAMLRHRISMARPATFAAVGIYAAFLHATGLPTLPLRLILVVVALEIALVAPYRWWYGTGRAPGTLLGVTFLVDLVLLVVILASIPDLPVEFHMLYLLVIIPVALASVWWGLAAIAVASASHVALLVLRVGANVGAVDVFAPIVLFLLVGQQSVQYSRRIAQIAREAETESAISAALLHASRELATFATSTALLQHVAGMACELARGEWACVLLRDAQRETYRAVALVSRTGTIDEEVRASFEIAAGDFPDELIARAGDGCAAVAADDPVIAPLLRDRWRIGALLAAALRCGDVPLGLLLVGMDGEMRDATSERLVVGIAAQAALALENARLLEDLRAASALKTEFMNTMSHELRSPLNAILGYVEMLRDEDGEPGNATREGRCALLERVGVYALQLLEMITATLDVSRLDAGRLPVSIAPVELSALVADVRSSLPEYWRKPAVVFEWTTGELPTVETDAAKVKTIIRNLVHNALKFTDAGRVAVRIGVAQVDAAADGPRRAALTLVVRDTGIGIAPDRRAVIFEMFRQGDGSDVRRHGGVGLGLYIVRRLVQVLDGMIHLDSVEGAGSEFTVTLPVCLVAVGRAADATDTDASDAPEGGRSDDSRPPAVLGRLGRAAAAARR